jgi:peptidoglycan/LPS O-acetylase OafA/YrhL
MNKYILVDFLRGYSIFTIVLMHLCQGYASGILSKALAFGGAGVHVFILCSGFGLYLSYLRKPLEYKYFLKRRFSKVWIPYVIAVIFWGIWLLMIYGIFPIKEVASHLFLYKMFSTELDTSLCYPYWFISTIIQFYLTWPLIVKIFRMNWGGQILIILSLVWSTIVGFLGLEEERPWGSFFLQYLWEFGLGMWIAERINEGRCRMLDVKEMKWRWLLTGAMGGMGLSAFMAWNGGLLKLYNDIPSLIGYLSVALLIYKIGVKVVNRFFEWTSNFGYELYLLHSLVYVVVTHLLLSMLPIPVLLAIELVLAYIFAYFYKRILIVQK